MPSKQRLRLCQSTKSGGAVGTASPLGMIVSIFTRRSGSLNGNGRNRTESMIANIAVLAPIPRAKVRTATNVKPGDFQRRRAAYLRSENMARKELGARI